MTQSQSIRLNNNNTYSKIEDGLSGQKGQQKVEAEVKLKVSPGKKLLGYMRRELNLFIWGTLALILGNLGTLAIPYYIGLFIDDMTRGNYDNIQRLVYELLIIIFVCTLLISNLIQISSVGVFLRGMLYNLVSERIGRNLRNDLYKSLVNKDVEFFDSKKTGDLRMHI